MIPSSDWNTHYPRPQFRRNSFLSLNGEWTLSGSSIQIPFSPQSRLSGYDGKIGDELRYIRTFTLPDGFSDRSKRIRLHFGAVDQIAEIYINSCLVMRHEGGYLPFFADITDVITSGENELTVLATDALCRTYPYGKQSKTRGGMWYTPVSGIWQTVYLEAVPAQPIEKLTVTPDLTGITLTVECEKPRCTVEIGNIIKTEIKTGTPVRIDIPHPHLWTVDDPHLYDLIVATADDRTESYFALRTVDIQGRKILLNGKPLFLNGVLDQGYFDDGLFLPSSPDGYEKDILRMKELGINLLRKHIKIEPESFYYACDRLGMLVMQDMVNNGAYRFLWDTALPTVGFTHRRDLTWHIDSGRRFFTQHAVDTVKHLYNHPCIISWTIFNEGWGQFNADGHYEIIKALDPTRIIDSTSGWFHQKKSDVDSRHVYFRNKRLKSNSRPLLLSECGGYARLIDGHTFDAQKTYGYGTTHSEEELTSKIALMWNEMVFPSIPHGLCGVIYTQFSDIEDEINGLYTYDRQVCKVNKDVMRRFAEQAQRMLEQTK